MNKSRVALVALIAAAVVAIGVSVVGFTASGIARIDKKSAHTAQLADKSKATTVRTQIERPLSLSKGEVKNIEQLSDAPDHIALKWDEVKGARKYNIYLCDKDSTNAFTKVAAVEDPTVDIPGLHESGLYWIKIAAILDDEECPATLLKTTTHVADVVDLDSAHSGSVLGLCWQENPLYDGYNIYRAAQANSNQLELYATIDNSEPAYNDKNVEYGKLYTYMVRPFREVEGGQVEAEGKTIELISGLCAPDGFVGRSANSRIVLYWQGKELADGYNIYRAKGDDQPYELIDTTEGNSYATDKLDTNLTYHFRVQPYRKVDDRVIYGTWSSCALKPVKADPSQSGVPTSTMVGTGTYIEISIVQQHMWFYENGKLIVDTDVVTGNDDGAHNTTTGSYAIQSHNQGVTLVGDDYETYVEYWMGFNGGIGIHDAQWRSSFGGSIYEYNGSHGCVNTPYDQVQIIFNHTSVGTPVYVY